MFCSVYLNLFAISAKSKILHRVLGMLLALTCIEKDFLGQIADSIFLVPCISGRDQIVVNIPKGHQSIFLKFSYVFYQIMYQHLEQTPPVHNSHLCFQQLKIITLITQILTFNFNGTKCKSKDVAKNDVSRLMAFQVFNKLISST